MLIYNKNYKSVHHEPSVVPGPKLGREETAMNLNQSLSTPSSQTRETGVLLKYNGMLQDYGSIMYKVFRAHTEWYASSCLFLC